MTATFPRKREDGTFSVNVTFESATHGVPEEIVSALIAWLARWSAKNREWTRTWEGKTLREETIRFDDAFMRPPYIAEAGDNQVIVRLDATASATEQFWKDWMVRLVEEITAEFPTIRLKSFASAE